MAFMFGCEGVYLEYPSKKVLEDVTLGVHDGDRIGIVGPNGEGKSSLLGVLSGSLEPDAGGQTARRGTRIGVLGQTDTLSDEDTVGHAIVGDAPAYQWASDPRIREVITALIADVGWDSLVGSLSGGQRRRVDLARLLVSDVDALLLDEPTNHLDMHAIAWLAHHLTHRWPKNQGALLVVTHDRWFLDEVCNRMWEVHDGTITPFTGGYSAYILQRVERDRVARVTEQRRRNIMRKELAWLSRGARARSTKPKFHVEAAEAIIGAEPPARNTLELKALAMQRLGKQVVDLTDVTVEVNENGIIPRGSDAAGTGHKGLDDVDWSVGPGERVGILGENGAGKTTLLRLITGQIQPTSGFVKIGKTVQAATLSQRLDELAGMDKYRVTEVLSRYPQRVMLDGKETTPAKLLERLGFNSHQLYDRIGELSGGQKRRLQLMFTLIQEPNMLVLDEPGNDMDTDMLAVLEDLLDTWAGTLVMVTHDRHLMERVTDDQYALIGGKIRHCPRGVDEYFELLDAYKGRQGITFADVVDVEDDEDAATSGATDGSRAGDSAGATGSAGGEGTAADSGARSGAHSGSQHSGTRRSEDASLTAADLGLSNAEWRAKKKELASLERKAQTAAGKVQDKQAEMAAADPTDFEVLARLQGELDDLKGEQTRLEDEWLDLAAELGEV